MNDNAALNLIRNTFENSFDRERFLIFAKNLFHFLDTDTFIYRGNLIPDAYDTHIKTLERLGKYEEELKFLEQQRYEGYLKLKKIYEGKKR